MLHLRTKWQAMLAAAATIIVCAGMSSAQVPAATRPVTLNGSAQIITLADGSPGLWLTPAQAGQAGSAFTSTAIQFGPNYGFTVFFQFRMTNPGGIGSADGMAFVLQTQGANALGGSGGAEGYVGITPSVAVEFDTWLNGGIDINDNHVAILTNGVLADLDPQTPYGVSGCQFSHAFGCMSNGDTWSVWIDYDGMNLNVALADNSTTRPANLISYPIDINSILGQGAAFVGFTAGTGSGYQNHFVFNIHPPPPADFARTSMP